MFNCLFIKTFAWVCCMTPSICLVVYKKLQQLTGSEVKCTSCIVFPNKDFVLSKYKTVLSNGTNILEKK